jgi:hypothetical protein
VLPGSGQKIEGSAAIDKLRHEFFDAGDLCADLRGIVGLGQDALDLLFVFVLGMRGDWNGQKSHKESK